MAEVSEIFDQPGAAFVLLPGGIKFPPIEKEWQKIPHSFQEANTHAAKGGNVGAMAGNGHIGLDQDAPDAFKGLELPITTTWETRPGRLGMRFTCTDRTPEVLAKYGKKADQAQIKLFKDGQPVGEIKLERTYQVIPPSWKTLEDGQRANYQLFREIPPAEISLAKLLADLQAVGITFSSRMDANAEELEGIGKKDRQRRIESGEKKARRYAEAALRGETLTLAGTPEGKRAGGGMRFPPLRRRPLFLGDLAARKRQSSYMDATSEDPDSFDNWLDAGYALCFHEKFEDAIKCFDEAIKLDPDSLMHGTAKAMLSIISVTRPGRVLPSSQRTCCGIANKRRGDEMGKLLID